MTLRMGDERRFSARWDFRRQENNFDDSSSDDPDSNSTLDPIFGDPSLVLESNQLDNGTTTVTREQPVKTRKRRSKKDESKPEKAQQVRRGEPRIVCAEKRKKKEEAPMEDKKAEEAPMEDKKTEETVTETDDVGTFMKTLLDELKASRESLMDRMSTELCGSSDQNVASRPHLKKRVAAVGVAAQRSVKKRKTKKEKEREKQRNDDEISEILQNGGEQVQELDYDALSLDMFLKSGYEGQKQKNTSEADTIMNLSSMVEGTGSETQQDDDNFAIPFAPSSLQSFPLGLSSLNSLFPSSSQGVTSFASNNNFQPPVAPQIPDLSEFQTGVTSFASNNNFQPVAPQIPDLSEFQTGFTGGQGFGNSLFQDNSYLSDFPASFQPNLIAGGYNFPAQANLATSSQQRDNNNMLGGLRMAGGSIIHSGNRFPEPEVGNGNNSFSDYGTGFGR